MEKEALYCQEGTDAPRPGCIGRNLGKVDTDIGRLARFKDFLIGLKQLAMILGEKAVRHDTHYLKLFLKNK